MKGLTEKINEGIVNTIDSSLTGLEYNDYLTREYNNLFAMLSGTIMRKIDTTSRTVYVIMGSPVRRCERFLWNDVCGIGTGENRTYPGRFISDHGFYVFNSDGIEMQWIVNSCTSTDAALTQSYHDEVIKNVLMVLPEVKDIIKDKDFILLIQ